MVIYNILREYVIVWCSCGRIGSQDRALGRFSPNLVVTINNAGKAEVLDTLAHGTLVTDGESAVDAPLFLVKVGSTHVLEAALVKLGPRGFEGRDSALGVAIEIGVRGRGSNGQGGERGEGEDGDLHVECVC